MTQKNDCLRDKLDKVTEEKEEAFKAYMDKMQEQFNQLMDQVQMANQTLSDIYTPGQLNEANQRSASPLGMEPLSTRLEMMGVTSPRGYRRALRQFENRVGSPVTNLNQMVREKSQETRGFMTAMGGNKTNDITQMFSNGSLESGVNGQGTAGNYLFKSQSNPNYHNFSHNVD